MSRADLSKGLELQVTVREDMYISKRCAGKQPSEGQACISCRYLRKALLTRQSRLKRQLKKKVSSTAQKLHAARNRIKRLASRSAALKDQLINMQQENALKPEEVLRAQIEALPPKQQDFTISGNYYDRAIAASSWE
ncbi:hypothetical protein HPB52_014548 [Rhipicephalus sanguineus]|uniref:Uncharacterized protein n=1 Tax=Rhipicephalus sanguineus TaxID=34632 RepID=A0A9D4Q745_RHISA|nr:hypothetical protein HPB52_014548 [Rhipicephalus sanguineus]